MQLNPFNFGSIYFPNGAVMKSQFVVIQVKILLFQKAWKLQVKFGKVTFTSGKSPFGLNSSFDDKAQCPYRLPR